MTPRTVALVAMLSGALAPMPAFAQSAAPGGPMKIETLDSGFVIASEARFGEINDALFRINRWLRLDAGVGYRAIGGADLLHGRLRGVSGTIALRLGGH